MKRAAAVLALAGVAPLLNGCIIAAIPAVAATTMVGSRVKARRDAQAKVIAAMPVSAPKPKAPDLVAAAPPPPGKPAPGEALTVPSDPAAPPAALATRGLVPAGAHFVPGSADSAALSIQAYRALTDYLAKAGAEYRDKTAVRQVVLADGASLAAPYFEPCGVKPPAVIFDVDETALPDLGFGGDLATANDADGARWQSWEVGGVARVQAVPGAVDALRAARAAGIDVIFVSNRVSARADDTVAALNAAGLGPVEHYKTLWLKGDDGGGPDKDNRRWAIASGYCVVALVGDQLGDFSDAFGARLTPAKRRSLAGAPALAPLWGDGWFVVPNPVYAASATVGRP